LLLDELSEMPIEHAKPNYCGSCQEKEVRPVGWPDKLQDPDCRIIAATNPQGEDANSRGLKCRRDLYIASSAVLRSTCPPLPPNGAARIFLHMANAFPQGW